MTQESNVVAEEYASSLSDLVANSKPLINMLTILADENIDHAPAIVQAVEKHLQKVRSEVKLPVLYLIDSIVKNVGQAYTSLFTQNIVSTFCSVFEKVDERTRAQMFKLRQTWNEVFPAKKLYAMDVRVSSIDPAWPITAPVPTSSIHFNPKFLKSSPVPPVPAPAAVSTPSPAEDPQAIAEARMREQLLKKQKKLLELQQKKLELELLQTKAKLEEQQKQLERQTDTLQVQLLAPSIQVGPEGTKVFPTTSLVATKPVKPDVPVSVAKEIVATSSAASVQVSTPPVTSASASSSNSSSRFQSKHKSDAKSRSTSKQVTAVSSGRSRDPRLATRQTVPQSNVTAIDHSHATPQPPLTQENTNTVFESVKLETAKPKHITINIANKGNVNKETQGVSKKDPRLIRNKVHVSNSKERTVGSVGSVGVEKIAVKSRGPSPSSPSNSGKAVPSLRKTNSKGMNASNFKTPNVKILSTSIIDLTDSPPQKVADKKETEVSSNKEKDSHSGAVSKTSSPSKLDNHKKKSPVSSNSTSSSSSSSNSSRQLPSDKKKGSSKSSETAGTGGSSSKRVKSPTGGTKSSRERPSPKKYDVFEWDVESPSPPPPPVISENKKKEETTFKVKVSKKSRKYVRKNRREKSRSPEPSVVGTTGDVDLRQGAPPEKHPRLTAFPQSSESVNSATEEDAKIVIPETIVDATTKDVDLRQLQRSPCKKRPSAERSEQPPPPKKTKAEMIDVLFGSEDVDLRQLTPRPVATQPSMPPSPPSPPNISQPSPTHTTTSSQDSSTNTVSSPKTSVTLEKDRDVSNECANEPMKPQDEDHVKENGGEKLFPQGWEKYKESKPDIYKSPFRSSELSKSALSAGTDSPVRDVSYASHRDRGVTHFNRRGRPEFDRLGRPLLYHRLPDDPGERRNSLSVTNPATSPFNEDTDMRPQLMDAEGGEHMDLSMNVIIAQAEEQLRNGSMTWAQYNTLLHQVIQLNEIHKLREAQRRDEMENKASWERVQSRRGEVGKASPRSQDEGSQGNSPAGARFGDIDERFPVLNVRNAPTTAPSPEPPSSSSSSLPPGPVPQWNELGSRHPRPVMWEQPPHTWLRGAPGPGGPLPPGPIPPPIRLLHQGPFHRQPAPSQDYAPGPNSMGSIGRWRPVPQFSSRPPFEGDSENRYDRFGMRFPGPPQPPPPPHQQPPHQQPPPPLHQQPPPQPHRPHSQPQVSEEQHTSSNAELPPADPMLLEMISQDTMRTIKIDRTPREIRYYGDVAIVMLAWDDPREILFQSGSRRVSFDDRETVLCAFNDAYRDFVLDGHTHRIRLGAPTRELYIDGQWYECFFGGPPIPIEIDGKIRMVKLEGPPPPVKIGFKRTDLVAGKINLIINARTMVPIFLDAKPQRFDIEGKPHVLRFTHGLSNVVINGRSFKVEFGGLPKLIVVRDKKHYIRFSVLPRGVRPGYVNIVNMEGGRLPSPPRPDTENSDSMGLPSVSSLVEDFNSDESQYRKGHAPVLPMLGPGARGRGQRRGFGSDRDSPHDSDLARSSPAQIQSENAVVLSAGGLQQSQPRVRSTTQLPLEMLTSLIPASLAPSCGFSYQVEQDSQDVPARPVPEVTAAVPTSAPALTETQTASTTTTTAIAGIPFLLPEINVDELYKKLVASGIVPQTDTATIDEKKEEENNAIKPVDFSQPETLKVRQPGLVAALYSGIQCSSCGVRFPPEQTMKYSQHLDWHFRQNRRDRDNTRKAQSRKWYYDISDWIQFEEIEDLEERAQSWFETQQAAEGRMEEKEPVEIPSVPAGENAEETFCDVCHDKFEQFYNEEREEWHLRYAIRVEGKTYHPVCYEDFKASLETSNEESVLEDTKVEESKDDPDVMEETPDHEGGDIETKTEKGEGEAAAEDEKTDLKLEAENIPEPSTQEEPEIQDEPEIAPKSELPIKEEGDPVESVQTALEESTLEDKEKELEGENESSIKTEPVEAEEEVGLPVAEIATVVDTTHTEVACSIDGNVKFEDNVQLSIAAPLGGKIKINITKPLPASKEPQSEGETESSAAEGETDTECKPTPSEEPSAASETMQSKAPEREIMEPPPPGVEPMQVKPRLVGRKLVDMPPIIKGTELSGLCTIM
ncbi:uncharacterized protein [Anabrus simplex]|uniref:uncharacterized protein isoform X2 n=1 Tax=Anabrus simplex TaxID=316456 RepID=UPI0035A26DE8